MGYKDYSSYIFKSYNKKKEDEEKNQISSQSKSNYKDYSYVFKKHGLEKTANFDTLETDINNLASNIQKVYDGWQTEETLNNTRSSIESMQKRISAYQDWRKNYGNGKGADLTELSNSYTSMLENFDELYDTYGKYDSADAYKKAMKEANEAAKIHESKKTADLIVVQKEIDDLQKILDTANTKRPKTNLTTSARKGKGFLQDTQKKAEEQKVLDDYLNSVGYSSIDDVEKALGEKKAYKNSAEYIQKGIKLTNDAVNSKNYKENTNFILPKETGERFVFGGSEKTFRNFSNDEIKYSFLDEGTRDDIRQYYAKSKTDMALKELEEFGKLADHLTEDERKTLYFYGNTQGVEKAMEYWHTLEQDLENRRGQEKAEFFEEAPGIIKMMYGVEVGLDQFTSGMENALNFKDEYIPTSSTQVAGQLIRDDLHDYGFDIFGHSIGQIGYDLISTTSNMAPSILSSAVMNSVIPGSGAVVGASLMGTSAAGNSYQQMLNQGYDKSQARTYGTLVGVAESGLQYAFGGISKLGGKLTGKSINAIANGVDNALGRFAITYGLSMASEGFEEAAQEVLNPFFENLAVGYSKNDLTDVEWGEVAYNGVLGALSAGFLESVPSAVSTFGENANAKKTGANIRANNQVSGMLDIASLSQEETDVYNLYTHYANKGVNAENISDLQLGRLHSMAGADAQKVLASDKTTAEEKVNAFKTGFDLAEMGKENVALKRANELSKGDETKVASTNTSASIEGIKIGKDDTTIITKDGEVSVNDMEFTQRDAELVGRAEQIAKENNETVANLFISQYDGQTDLNAYNDSFNLVKSYAINRFSNDYVLEHKGVLSGKQASAIYNHFVTDVDAKMQKELDDLKVKHKNAPFEFGSFNDSVIDYNNSGAEGKVNWNDLNDDQKNAIVIVGAISQQAGMDVELVIDGEERGFNGNFNINQNKIQIDVFAGMQKSLGKNMDNLIFPTLSHEVTHWMERKAPELYQKYSDFVMESLVQTTKMSEKDILDTRLRNLIKAEKKRKAKYEAENPGKTYTETEFDYDYVRREVIARASEDVLGKSEVIQGFIDGMTKDEKRTFIEGIKEFLLKMKDWFKSYLGRLKPSSAEAKAIREATERIDEQVKMWDAMLKSAIETNQALKKEGIKAQKNTTDGDVQFAEREIIGASGKSYGIGVYLDSNLLTGLTDSERKQMVKMFVTEELEGEHFVAYDNNNDAIDVGIAKKSDTIKNKKGKKRQVLKELYHKHIGQPIKQEAVVLVDELIKNAKYDKSLPSNYSHDWLDDNGKNNWDYWKVFIQEKNKTVWKATLIIANTTNGEKILYDIDPIKIVEEAIKSASTSTNNSIHQNNPKSQEKFQNSDRDDVDMQFALRETVEETKELVAVHNLSEEKLLKSLNLGGLPMPSIAIIKAREGHNAFGSISLVFDKSTIDPNLKRSNKVYSGDAWTPTYPRVEYKISYDAAENVRNKINNLLDGTDYKDAFGYLSLDTDSIQDYFNRNSGDVYDAYGRKEAFKLAYLKEKGVDLELPKKQEEISNRFDNDVVIEFANKYGEEKIRQINNSDSQSVFEQYVPEIKKLVEEHYSKQFGEKMDWEIGLHDVYDILDGSLKYFSKGIKSKTVNSSETRKMIDEAINETDYKQWLNSLFSGIVEKEGIRNEKDLFTPSGNRRSFEALHYEHNLENVIKAMKGKGTKGVGSFGHGNIFGAATTEYGSIAEIKEDAKKRMQNMTQEEYDEIRKGFSDRMFELAYSLPIHKDSFTATDSAANMLIEAVVKYKTKSGMANYLRTESKGWATYSDHVVDDLVELVNDIRNMPVGYFEAKPERAVGFNEIATVILPNDVSNELKTKLNENNINFVEYEKGNEKARLEVLNSLEGVQFADRETVDNLGNELSNEQIEYFKDSKVRDDNGNLLVVYHGTRKADFTVFKRNANFFTDSQEMADSYAPNGESYTGYLNITKPFIVEANGEKWSKIPIDESLKNMLLKYGAGVFKEDGKWRTTPADVVSAIQDGIDDGEFDYDGVIIKNVDDTGSYYKSKDNIIATDYITFNSNQFKNIDNKKPTSNPDIRYADRDEVDVYELLGENERLIKENEKFKKDIDRLNEVLTIEKERRKLESQVTHGSYFNTNQINSAATYLRKLANTTYDKVELMKQLRDFYSYIANAKELAWEDVYSKSYSIAKSMLAERKEDIIVNDYFKDMLKDFRTTPISLNENQIGDAKYLFGNHYHRFLFNKFKVTKDGKALDLVWKEDWAPKYGFDTDISDTEMVNEMYKQYEVAKQGAETVAEYNEEEMARWLANEIYNQYWNVAPIRTTADKYNKRINELKAEHRNAMRELRDDYNNRIADSDKLLRKQTQLAVKLLERKEKEIAEVKKLGQERMAKYKENAEIKTRIQSITSNALTLNKWLTTNSKDYHIHDNMKTPVIALLNAIDFSSKRMLDKNYPTKQDVYLSKALSKVRDMMADATNLKEGLEALYGHDMDEELTNLVDSVDNIMRSVGDNEYVLNRMTLEELKTLDKLVRTIKHTVTKLNQFHTVHHNKGIVNLAHRFMAFGDKLGKIKKQDGNIAKHLKYRNCTPYYYFKRLGEAGELLFEAFQDGWDKLAFNSKQIIDFTKEVYTDKEVKSWTTETEKFTFDINGESRTFEMSIAQIMALHCVSKQEDAIRHLLSGGMTLARLDKKGNVVADYENIPLGINEIYSILATLDKRQKKVADKLQEFMNTVCSDWGNEISMARFGIKMFGMPDYFPIKVSPTTIPTDNTKEFDNASLFRLLNMSFTKSRNEYANQSIEIGDIFDIFAQHTTDMAKYNALALPVLDFNKFYSIKGKDDRTNVEYGVDRTLRTAYGNEAVSYVKRFIRDINGSQNVSRDAIGKTFFKNAKVASVAANLRVVLLQPTAFFKASAVLDNKYLIKAGAYMKVNPISMKDKYKKAIAKAEKYCGIIQWKALGYYDTDISKGIAEKVKHAENFKDKAIEKSLKGAELADRLTFGTLWTACEFEIRDTRKDLKVGSDEFYQAIAKRLREVIYATQVVDSTVTRTDLMRSPDGWDKMATTFGSEPAIAYNMLMDMVMQYRQDKKTLGKEEAKKKNGKKIRKVIAAYTITNAIAALVESGFDAFRDDDDEEETLEQFMVNYLKNFALDMSIGNKIPYLKEAYSALQGYSSSRMDTQWFEYVNGILTANNFEKVLKNGLKLGSNITGFAFYNVYRDLMATLFKLGILDKEDIEDLFS